MSNDYLGIPINVARSRLETLGFQVFGNMPKSYRRSSLISEFDEKTRKRINRVEFHTACDEVGEWGQKFYLVRLFLYFDEQMNVTEISIPNVQYARRVTPFAWYFHSRADLREPLGMPIEEARAMMERAGFRCSRVAADKQANNGRIVNSRPYLYCRAVAETPLGGSIIRVRLFHDDAGRITDSFVLKDQEAFDELLCMLPDVNDTPTYAVFKTVVFPARLYAALVVGGLQANLAMGRP